MKIVWMTWKDREHPLAGGAEVINEALAERLVRDGHEVVFLVGGFVGGTGETMRNGFRIVRLGGRLSVYWHAFRYYRRHLRAWADLVIDEVNTISFFASWYSGARTILFIHQLAREIWFYEMRFPFSLIGYIAEAVYLRLLSRNRVITVSESSKRDLERFGFATNNIHIISEGIEIEPLADLAEAKKAAAPTMLALGTIRAMKRTDHILKAFEIAKQSLPDLKLVVAGKAEGRYGKRVVEAIARSPYAADISYLGPVSPEHKIALMRKAHVLCVTSVKEGWGLVVTEANSQGTPAVVYDVDGLRDSVKDGVTGIVCGTNTPKGMGEGLVKLLSQQEKYQNFRRQAWEWSKDVYFDRAYTDFISRLFYV